MKTGVCRLCRVTTELCESHVIPELCYKPTYDENHRARKLVSNTDKVRKQQKGFWEHLLCLGCENRLSKFETAFERYWWGAPALPERITLGMHTISGFDYVPFKLFHLSIIGRASVSSLREFDPVRLGPYDEKLRNMLFTGDPGPADHFPIFGIVLLNDDRSVMYAMVMKPQRSRLGSAHVYYLCYGGCEWYFVITERPDREAEPILAGTPRPDGTMRLVAQPWTRSGSVRAFLESRKREQRA